MFEIVRKKQGFSNLDLGFILNFSILNCSHVFSLLKDIYIASAGQELAVQPRVPNSVFLITPMMLGL